MFKYTKDGISVLSVLDKRRPKADGKYPVKIQVVENRLQRYYQTGKNLSAEEWDKLPVTKNRKLIEIRESIENSFSFIKDIVEELAYNGEFSFDALNRRLSNGADHSIITAFQFKIADLKANGRIGNMTIYQTVCNNIRKFAGEHVSIGSITPDWLRRFEKSMIDAGKSRSTISIHLRTLRAVMNDAKREGIIKESKYPFGKGKFEVQEGSGRKLALTMEQIGQIARYDDGTELTAKYRDFWLFIYFCNGINVADLIHLKFRNIVGDELCYIRQKTKFTSKVEKEIRVIITPPMLEIIQKWGNPPKKDNYIFPVIEGLTDPQEIFRRKQAFTRAINQRMAMVAEKLGIPSISTYTARHSFATVLKRSGANIAFISESLGHSDLKTTENYLASFEKEERQKNAALLTNF